MNYRPNPSGWKVVGVCSVLFVLVVAFFFFVAGFNRVEAGHVAAVTRSGKLVGCKDPGLRWDMPIVTAYHDFNTRKQTYELVDGEPKDSDSKAEHTDYNIDTHTKEGVVFSAKLTAQYHIDPAQVCAIFPMMRSDDRVFEQVVKFHVRAITPQVLNTYTADDLYFGNLGPISQGISDQLKERFFANGVVLDYFEIKRGTFDARYEEAIQGRAAEESNQKLIKSQQETQRQQNEKDRVTAEGRKVAAEIDAENAASVAKINAQAEADKAGIAAKAEASRVVVAAQAQSDAKKLQAEADAAYVSSQVQAYGGPENYTEIVKAQAMAQAVSGAKAIYLPSDSINVFGELETPTP